jgi:hypothetical protein
MATKAAMDGDSTLVVPSALRSNVAVVASHTARDSSAFLAHVAFVLTNAISAGGEVNVLMENLIPVCNPAYDGKPELVTCPLDRASQQKLLEPLRRLLNRSQR